MIFACFSPRYTRPPPPPAARWSWCPGRLHHPAADRTVGTRHCGGPCESGPRRARVSVAGLPAESGLARRLRQRSSTRTLGIMAALHPHTLVHASTRARARHREAPPPLCAQHVLGAPQAPARVQLGPASHRGERTPKRPEHRAGHGPHLADFHCHTGACWCRRGGRRVVRSSAVRGAWAVLPGAQLVTCAGSLAGSVLRRAEPCPCAAQCALFGGGPVCEVHSAVPPAAAGGGAPVPLRGPSS